MGFTFVSGHIALDFAGTVGRRGTDSIDLLAGPADLSRWAVEASMIGTRPAVTARVFADALELREAIHRLACAAREGRRYANRDLATVNRMAAGAPADVCLRADGTVRRDGDIDAVLHTVGRAAIELLGGPLAGLIKECGGPRCTRAYLDTSRHGNRRWCDMRLCGNRAKAAAFRARHAR